MLIVLDTATDRPDTVIVEPHVLRHTDLAEFAGRLLREVPSVERVRIFTDDLGRGQPEVDVGADTDGDTDTGTVGTAYGPLGIS